jgi:hypothetical protein
VPPRTFHDEVVRNYDTAEAKLFAQQLDSNRREARWPLGVQGRIHKVTDHHHGYAGLDRCPERREVALQNGLQFVVHDGSGFVRIFEGGAMVGEVFGGGDDAGPLGTLDKSGAHKGDEGRVIPIGATPDGGSSSRIDHGREVRVHTAAPELAPYLLGYSASFLWIRPAPDLRRRGLLRYPRGAPYLPTLIINRDEQRDGGLGLHGEPLQ